MSQTLKSVSTTQQDLPVWQGQGRKPCHNIKCTNIKLHCTVCTLDIEMLMLPLHPFHLLREFPTIVISCVYIPASADTGAAAELVAEGASQTMAKYPDALVFMGNCNRCRLNHVMPSFRPYVNIPTRNLSSVICAWSCLESLLKTSFHTYRRSKTWTEHGQHEVGALASNQGTIQLKFPIVAYWNFALRPLLL